MHNTPGIISYDIVINQGTISELLRIGKLELVLSHSSIINAGMMIYQV